MSSYEQHCIDFALFGDPEREHWDYEFNAQYDRYDGWGDPDPCDNPEYVGEMDLEALADLEDYEEIDENGVGYDDYPDDEVPF